ncbi:unnamed protein product [Clonostachys rosea]|uniref:Uncharacterized protein n=1 Tax=Bionectria ochroleuca TaxID=29856 RepID=A0ABY6U081_BIOOC|nr:unnamed protein product [Clonostachys rosea]
MATESDDTPGEMDVQTGDALCTPYAQAPFDQKRGNALAVVPSKVFPLLLHVKTSLSKPMRIGDRFWCGKRFSRDPSDRLRATQFPDVGQCSGKTGRAVDGFELSTSRVKSRVQAIE